MKRFFFLMVALAIILALVATFQTQWKHQLTAAAIKLASVSMVLYFIYLIKYRRRIDS